MTTRDKATVVSSAALPLAALAVFLFAAPPNLWAEHCAAGECKYADSCYSSGACIQSICTGSLSQECEGQAGWSGCKDCV